MPREINMGLLYQGPFQIEQDDWYAIYLTTPPKKPVRNPGIVDHDRRCGV
ncbi:hypothetical protein [Paenibacillus montanisoli]|nr:hypothetical protein [Paenibacillus montanisoli]